MPGQGHLPANNEYQVPPTDGNGQAVNSAGQPTGQLGDINEPNIIKAPLLQDNMNKGDPSAGVLHGENQAAAAHLLNHGQADPALLQQPSQREADNDVNKQDTDTSD